MHAHHRAEVEAIRADTRSGATDLVLRAADLLLEAGDDRASVEALAIACAEAQPAMAGLRTLRRIATDGSALPGAIRQFREQVRRAPSAIARFAVDLLLTGAPPVGNARPALRLATVSSSRAVEAMAGALCRHADVTMCCAESRPAREGVALASRLRDAGATVELWGDAAMSAAIPECAALVFGADAVGPEFLVNKAGTAALCAWASHLGIATYALAGREKMLTGPEMEELVLVEGPAQLGEETPVEVAVRNPYFERVPLGIVTGVLTDRGLTSGNI
jgi:translation initiation factor 2B subunit (eIF-2B alpha/beta/delta family)